jgi:aspartate aminotransferase
MPSVSKKTSGIEPSLTLAIDAKAKQMVANGEDIVSFAAGETDFDTPDFIKQEAIDSLNKGFTKYTPASGILELKQAIQEKYKREQGLEYTTNEIIVSNGAKHSLYNIFQAVCNPGDEVIIPSPYWLSYAPMAVLADAVPVMLNTAKSGFAIDPAELKKLITPKSKMFLFNNPSNPTGRYYTKSEIMKIAEVLEPADLWVVSDEIYDALVYVDEPYVSIASLSPELKKKTLVVNGVSKTYAMTGWRLGYTCGDKNVISIMDNLQSHSTSNPVSFSQKGGVKALREGGEFSKKLRDIFKGRRDVIFDMLSKIDGISIVKPEGAFYAFPDVSRLYGKSIGEKRISGSLQFCEALLETEKVAAVPGIVFGDDKFIRLSYATSEEKIKKGIGRLASFINKLK